MISLKDNLKEEDNIESYHFILIDLCESIMNNFISDKNINDNIDKYKQMLDDIKQKLIINEESYEKLKLSEFYLKISYDENIKEIFDNYFVYDDSDNFSTNLLIKLLLLKICQNLFLLSQCKDSLFICDDNITRINELYRMLLSVSILSKTYLCKDNNELYKEKISNFINFIKNEITTNISTLLVISNTVNDNMSVKCDELISFWNRLFTALNMNISDSERKINEDISSLLFDNKNTLQCYLLSNKCLDQISNVSTLLLKLYNETNFTKVKIKKNNLIVKVFKEISVFDSDRICCSTAPSSGKFPTASPSTRPSPPASEALPGLAVPASCSAVLIPPRIISARILNSRSMTSFKYFSSCRRSSRHFRPSGVV